MRLTLRTLLAYLDGILESNDAQDVGKKIEESEYATGLVHRIRDVMRRLRLGAPGLTDRGPKLDPNTVAEYLDNTLVSEDVTDFEKVCLDSDVHLAEVASCHQILTLVLGEPAEIDSASRQRMYQLKDAQVSAAPSPPPIGAPSASVPPTLDLGKSDGDSTERKPRTKPTVPEYLRESHKGRGWAPKAAAVLLIACFTVVVLMALGQFEPGTPLGNALVRWGVREAGDEGRGTGEELPPPKTIAAVNKEPVTGPVTDTVKEPVKGPVKESVEAPAKEPVKTPATGLVIKPEIAAEPGAAVKPAEEAGKKPPAEAVAAAESKPAPESGTEPGAKQTAEPPPLPPEPLARLTSSDQVLLKDDPASGWVRVAANQMLMPQRLLALPTYRAKLTLTVGVTLEILGGAQIELLASGPQELPGIRVLYGRIVLTPLAKTDSGLRVAFGNRAGVISFADAESVAALEVRRIHPPGTDPEAEPPHIVADLYAAAGGVLWDKVGGEQGEKTLRLAPSQWVSFNAGLTSAPAASNELPKWIAAEPLSALDRRASASVAQALPTDRLARLGLLELSTSRPQKEVKWLALRCLGYIGQYRDMATVLNDVAYKLDWPEYIDQLREAVSRDSVSAAAVRLALEKQYPQQAAELYRMLWGYSDKDLQAGEDATLVKALDDDTLAVRVLSSWNLKDLTGLGLFYRPEQTASKRQQPTLRWRQRLEAKEIRLKTPEEKAGADDEKAAPPAPGP